MNAKLIDLGEVAFRTKSTTEGNQLEQNKNTCSADTRRPTVGLPCP